MYKKRVTRGACLAGVTLFIGIHFFACKKPIAPDPSVFERWFVGTEVEPPPILFRTTATGIDSLVVTFRKQSAVGKQTIILSDITGSEYTVGFQTPPSVSLDTIYPCIVYLHGGIGTTLSNKGERAYEMLGMLADSMELFLVSPSANREVPWWSAAGLSRILQTIRYMTLHYPINPDKVFLAGVSDGATGCWAAANTIAAPFAGFFAVSGFGGMLPQLGMKLYPQNCMQRPIYTVHAGNDRLYPLSVVNRFLDQMESSGVGVKRRVYSDEEHGFDYRLRETTTFLTLLRKWSLPRNCAFQWYGEPDRPSISAHIVSMEHHKSTSHFSIRGYSLRDTFFLYTNGLASVQMYFDSDNRCVQNGIFKINDRKGHRYSAVSSNRKLQLLLLRQRCFPLTSNWTLFSLPL